MANLEITKFLSEAVTRLNNDEVEAAEALLQPVLDSGIEIPQAGMLMGVVRLRQKRLNDAENLFGQVLRKQPDQPDTLFYLGNVQRDKGAITDAVVSYRHALRLRTHFSEAELALATSLRMLGHLEEAKRIYEGLVGRIPDWAEALCGLGSLLNEMGEYREAEHIFAEGLKLPASPELIAEIENGLGTAKISVRRFAEALPHFERAMAVDASHATARRNRARALEYLNRPERAAEVYRRLLVDDPLDLKTHLLLNELLHRSGHSDDMLRSYDEAARAKPSSPVPATAKGDQLLLLQRTGEAADSYRRALRLKPDHLAAHIGLGRALSAMGDLAGALEGFEAARKLCPGDPDLDTAFAYALLRTGDFTKALDLAQQAITMVPTHQAALAVLGLCYRAKKDEREELLNGYERFVQIFDMEPPPGYDSIASFHAALRSHLGTMHEQAKEFFSQTLRGGTRTIEDIFELHHPLRDALKDRIAGAVSQYIGTMPQDADHPFLSRRQNGRFRFSGSWSSRMSGGGYHVNHIHSGWISSVYYVDVPDISSNAAGHQGWLKFGEPSTDLGFDDPIRRLVQPKPGRLVLFPSYLWHGTVPFNSDETRMTIAFDAVPFPNPH